LIGKWIPAYRKQVKRRLIAAPKFIFFDVGIVSHLTKRGEVLKGSELFVRVFEHFITLEVIAHSSYSGIEYPIQYWRTASQFEVDLILGKNNVAIEIKSTNLAKERHLRGLRAFKQEHPTKCILVSMDPRPRKTSDDILILPWEKFLEMLWSNKIMG
jgi:predicted AAA+ superfamily ATPase